MSENPFRYQKNLDLHESEWRKEGKKEPFFGPGLGWFLNVTLPLLVFAVCLSLVGKFIYRALLGY